LDASSFKSVDLPAKGRPQWPRTTTIQ